MNSSQAFIVLSPCHIILLFQMNEVFVDTKKMPIMKKLVKPTDQQTEFESRR